MRHKRYECDECGRGVRRITIHAKEFSGETLHFCGTKCMDDYFANQAADRAELDAVTYWLTGQDLRDGA